MTRFIRLLIGLIVLAGLALPFTAAAQGPVILRSSLGFDNHVCGIPVVFDSFAYGLTYGSAFQVQNLEAEAEAITITFYDQAGGVVSAAIVNDTIAAGGSKTYFAVMIAGLTRPFAGSAVIASAGAIRAMSSLAANSYAYGASSSAYNEGATQANLPLVMRNNSGYYTWFAVQNAGTSDATVGVVFTAGSAGTNYTAPDVTIKPGASHLYYQADMADLGAKFVGSAKVTSKNGVPIVATVVEVGPTTLYAYDGFVAASPTFIAPLFQYYNAGFTSSIQVENTGAAATDVTIQYTPSFGGNACTETKTIAAGGAATYGLFAFASAITGSNCYAQNPGTAFVGSATVSANSASQPLVAIVNQHNFASAKAASYSAFRPDDGTQQVSVPLVMDRNSNYWTGVVIYNAGASTTVTIDYSGTTADKSLTLPAGASAVVLNNGAIGARYVGSAVVSGANSTDKLLVIVNEQNLVAAGDTFYVYNAFNQKTLTPGPTPTPRPPEELYYDDGAYDNMQLWRAAAVRFTVAERRQVLRLRYHLRGSSGPVQLLVYDANWSVLYRADVTPDGSGHRWFDHDVGAGVAVGPGDFYVGIVWPSEGAEPQLDEDASQPDVGRSYGDFRKPDPPFSTLHDQGYDLDLMIRAVVQ
jgi:hypothetical protein